MYLATTYTCSSDIKDDSDTYFKRLSTVVISFIMFSFMILNEYKSNIIPFQLMRVHLTTTGDCTMEDVTTSVVWTRAMRPQSRTRGTGQWNGATRTAAIWSLSMMMTQTDL